METIGKYQIHRVLGHGAMGTVYEALDPQIQRKVALKTMLPGLTETPDLRVRFLREAQAAGGLRHRNIVTVYDLGEDKGRPFIAMELIEGTDLEKIVQNHEPLSMEWKLDVLRQVCEGLSYAHRAGIVHRDIKPANIRVTPEGEVKIMDFGIAHLQSSSLTKSGLVMGTVHYMAPEQIEGHKVDHRADIFSVGAIAYELIAYRRAFEGESITAVMYRIIHENPDPKGLPASEYSPGIEHIVMKALAKKLDDRYQSLDAMLSDLTGLVRETAPRLAARPHQRVDREAATQAFAFDLEKEKQRRRVLVDQWVQEGTHALSQGHADKARELAKQAQALIADDAAVKKLMVDVESEALRQRVEREMGEMRGEVEEARAAGQLQKALTLCRRLLELNPDDVDVARVAAEIEAAIHEKEVEELCSQALSYATDGDLDLAQKIAGRVERFAAQSARYLELKAYLEEEGKKRKAAALTGAAQEHLAQGRLAEAQTAAEEALGVLPEYALAREIRDRLAGVLAMRGRADQAETAEPAEKTPAPGETPRVAAATKAPGLEPAASAQKPQEEGAVARKERIAGAPTARAPRGPSADAAVPPGGAAVRAATPQPPAVPAKSPARQKGAPAAAPSEALPVAEGPPAAVPPPSPVPTAASSQPPAAAAPPKVIPKAAPKAPPRAGPPLAPPTTPSVGPTSSQATREPPTTGLPSAIEAARVTAKAAPSPPTPSPGAAASAARPAGSGGPPTLPPGARLAAMSASPQLSATSPELAALTPLPEGPPSNPEAATLLEAARRHLRDRERQKALPLLEQAAALEAEHAGIQRILKLTRLEARKAEAEALTNAALEFFMKNKYAKARQAVDKALSLEPENKKAKELMKLLAALV